MEPAGRGITLVPCVFAWPRVMILTEPGYRPTLAYGPAVANLWSSSSPASNGTALEAASAPFGRPCSRVSSPCRTPPPSSPTNST